MTVEWFVLFAVLLVIELLTVNLVTVWFAFGAVAAIICSFFTDSIFIQLLVFLITSVMTLLVMKPLLKRFKSFDITPTNLDRVIGKIGEVTKSIDQDKYGEVKILGSTWTASSKSHINIGERVKVLSIDGVKLIVQKEEK